MSMDTGARRNLTFSCMNIIFYIPYITNVTDNKFTNVTLVAPTTAMPNQKENVKTTAKSNFDAEAFGDMFSTLYNRI